MGDELIAGAGLDLVQMALEVRAGHLGTGPDGAGEHLVDHARGLEFEQVRAGFVDAGDQQADAVRPLAVLLGVCLGAIGDLGHDAVNGDGSAVCHSRAERLLLHEVGDHPGVGGQAGDGNAHVGVDFDDLLLIRGELFGVSLLVHR